MYDKQTFVNFAPFTADHHASINLPVNFSCENLPSTFP